ncbi:MAG: MG2 domain-containing protein [bacterium]
MMKTIPIWMLWFAVLLPGASQGEITLDKDQIQTERKADALLITLPLQNALDTQAMGDLVVTLLDESSRSLAKVEKKLVLFPGGQSEQVAMPVAAGTPEMDTCRVRIDLMGHTWLKRLGASRQTQDVHVIGQPQWLSGSQAVLRVVVTRAPGNEPVAGAAVTARCVPAQGGEAVTLAEAVSDERGNADVRFAVPGTLEGSQTLTVTIESAYGKDEVTSEVQIVPGTRIFLTTDKPVYQPGQLIHIRALVVNQATGVPLAEKAVTLEVFDGKGNKVFKEIKTTSEFGIVAADFQLAEEVNQGEYRFKAILDKEVTEKTAQVYEYVLPKFRVAVHTERTFYAPGESVKGNVEARYFFGKPVAGAKVKITANCFDVGFNEFETVNIETGEEGRGEFSFVIPDKLVGQPLFKGDTIVQLDVRVRDSADHEEQKIHTFPVAVDPIQVDAIPESGKLVPGVENEIYLVASHPDGSVAKPKLRVDSRFLPKSVELQCDANGIASVTLIPQAVESTPGVPMTQNVAVPRPDMPVLSITAEEEGRRAVLVKDLETENAVESLLLRVDKGVYTVGQAMNLTVFSPAFQKETAFLDIIKNGQTVLTKTLPLADGRAALAVPLDNALSGTLALSAYVIRPDGNLVRDTRQVVVLRSDDLRIEITSDQEQYEPGQPARLRVAVRSGSGEPVRAAMGLHIVDESVYSLSEKEPGLAKVFFAIEKELLQPKVEIHGYALDKVVRLSAVEYEKNANLSKALLSKLDVSSAYALNIFTGSTKIEQARQEVYNLQNYLRQTSLPMNTPEQDAEELLLSLNLPPDAVKTVDPWGVPFRVDFRDNRVGVSSAGPDGKFNTADDIQGPADYYQIMAADGRSNARWYFIKVPAATGIADAAQPQEPALQGDKGGRAGPGGDQAQYLYAVPNVPVDRYGRRGFNLRRMGGPMERGRAVGDKGSALLDGIQQPEIIVGAPIILDMAKGAERLARVEVEAEMAGGYGMMAAPEEAPAGAMPMDLKESLSLAFPNVEKNNQPELAGADFRKLAGQDESGIFVGEKVHEAVPAQQLGNLDLSNELQVPDPASVLDPDKAVALGEEETLPLAVNGEVDGTQLRESLLKQDEESRELKHAIREEIVKVTELEQQMATTPASPAEIIRNEAVKDKSVRVRRYFPETLFYTPELITDEQGLAMLNLPVADSITTWRMSAMANAKNGAVGDSTAALKVFKPFFVDLDLPVALIQDDEVTIPVAVYNYLPAEQTVQVELERAPWFDLLEGGFERRVSVAANEVTSVSYRVRATRLGKNPLTVYAWGTEDRDATGRDIEVRPNGEARYITFNGRLDNGVKHTVMFPEGRVPGADKLFVKIYPGIFSQVVEGLDSILQMPNGCFEQTSSTTYPNVLALNYMKQTQNITPEIEMKAREYINLGYQRLLTFEIPGGGFQVFGNPPATRVLTAYGLMEFADMNEVYPVDENLIPRTARWLIDQRRPDGTWDPDENYAHAEMWQSIQDNPLLTTAYVALALSRTEAPSELGPTTQYLLEHAGDATDAYTLGILCNALQALVPDSDITRECVQRLVNLGEIQGNEMHWAAEASMSYARGDHASVEATAWAAMALIQDGRFNTETGKALNWLIQQKDPQGTWGTTHGTVLALKAMVLSLKQATREVNATVLARVNGQDAARLAVTPENADLFRQIDLSPYVKGNEQTIEIDLEGEGSLLYQVVGTYFEPWGEVKTAAAPFDIQVDYDRKELRRNDTVTCRIHAKNQRPERVEMVMIDVGIPPGFRVERPTLDEYVDQKTIARYTLTARQLLIYLESMEGGAALDLEVPMKATLPMTAKAPEAVIYEYYNPEQKQAAPPSELEVK